MSELPSSPSARSDGSSEQAAEATVLEMAARSAKGRSIAPEEVARALATGPDWQLQLPLVRRVALRLAAEGRLVIYRKGKPIDPAELRGVYRLGLPSASDASAT